MRKEHHSPTLVVCSNACPWLEGEMRRYGVNPLLSCRQATLSVLSTTSAWVGHVELHFWLEFFVLHMFMNLFACSYLECELRSVWHLFLIVSQASILVRSLNSSSLRQSCWVPFMAWVICSLSGTPLFSTSLTPAPGSWRVYWCLTSQRPKKLAPIEFAGAVPISLAVDPSGFVHQTI